MPPLMPVKITGRIEAVLINPDRARSLASTRVDGIRAGYDGFAGDAHGGLTRGACSRVKLQYAVGTEIRNTRQVSIVSVEELARIAANMELDRVEPEWLGANLLISGIPDLSLVPPSSRLISTGGASIVVDMENSPCKFPGEVIDVHYPGFGARFPKAAVHLRGVTGWIERPGTISIGDELVLHVPRQRPYPHAGTTPRLRDR